MAEKQGVSPNKRPQRVYAFIDSQNLNLGVQKLGWKMDWRKFRQWLADTYGVSKAFMFIGYVPEFESLYQQMHEAGYMVVLKPTFDMSKPQVEKTEKKEGEEKHTKGNVDADLVLWAMKEMSNYEKAIIVSGDGDFYTLIEYLAEKNRLLKILTPNRYYSSLFNKFEDFIERLDNHRRELAYHDRPKKPQNRS